MATDIEKAPEALQELVAKVDTGARKPAGVTARVIFTVALAWALFQFWYASPLPFTFGIGILNDTEARSLHLAFALFLAFLAWPALGSSPRDRVPILDWAFALAGAFAGAYLLLFYRELAMRPGQPTTMDIAVAVTGIVLLLEATRRSVGWPMAVLAALFIAYSMGGAVPARRPVAQGGVGVAADVAHVAHHRRRVRHRAGRVHRDDLRLRAVRHAARPRGRRQLHDAGRASRRSGTCAAGRRRWRSSRRR